MRERLRAALRMNSTQREAILMLTLLNLIACLTTGRENFPWWGWLVALLLWPLFAFVGNIFNPILDVEREG